MRKLIFQIQRLLAWKHFYVLIAVVGLVGGAVIFLPKILGGKVLSMTIYAVPTVVPTPIPTPPPIPTPTPTPTPSPTPTPVYTGYCLNVPVIFYHHIQPLAEAKTQGHESLTVDNGVFDTQMAYLKSKGYTTISAQQLANALFSKQGVPGHSIVVSVDDGYSDFFSYGYPIAQKYGINVSLAIPTGLMNNGGYMSWDQLKQMVGGGTVSLYNHSWSHANLAGVAKDKAQYEVSTAKKQLGEYAGANNNAFFYPYGGSNNVAIDVVRENGYGAAYTTMPGTVQCDSFLMGLHRTRIGNSPLSSYGL